MIIKKKKDKEKVTLCVKRNDIKLQRKAAAIVHEIYAIKEKILFSAEQ